MCRAALEEGATIHVVQEDVVSRLVPIVDSLALEGRYAIIAFLQGPVAELNLRVVLARRLMLTGSTLRPQSIDAKTAIAASVEERVLPLLASGAVKPVIDSTFPLAEAAAAHSLMESSRHMGKIVLTVR